MNDDKITEIQDILSDVDTILRERLAIGLKIPHILLTIAPDGAGVVRSNVGPEGIADMAELLAPLGEEEKPGVFAQAQAHGVADDELARRLRERKEELQGRAAD